MEEDPPDPDGVPGNPRPLISVDKSNIEQINRKRPQSSSDTNSPQKRLIINPAQPLPSIQSIYTHPDYIEKKSKYSDEDSSPFIVHVNKIANDLSSGAVLKPIKFGHFLFHNNIKNIVCDGVKRVGRNRISVEFKSAADANTFIDHPALSAAKYETVIPTYNVTRMGIVRQVPIEWTLEELVTSIKVPSGFGKVIKARRLNRRSVNETNNPIWTPTQTVVLTFSGQKLPTHIYCFYTSLPIETYLLPIIQCYKCCRFGHVTSQCRSSPRCFICAQNHEGVSCSHLTPTCLFCSGSHSAKDPSCPEHSRQKSLKLVMSQENISYLEASARFPPVRRSFADTTRALNPNIQQISHTVPNDPSTSLPSSSQISSHRKTIFIPRHSPNPSSGIGYDKSAHHAIIETPASSLSNGCALTEKNSISPNDNLFELLISMLISMLSRFSDTELPCNLRQKLTELFSLARAIRSPINSSMELSEH